MSCLGQTSTSFSLFSFRRWKTPPGGETLSTIPLAPGGGLCLLGPALFGGIGPLSLSLLFYGIQYPIDVGYGWFKLKHLELLPVWPLVGFVFLLGENHFFPVLVLLVMGYGVVYFLGFILKDNNQESDPTVVQLSSNVLTLSNLSKRGRFLPGFTKRLTGSNLDGKSSRLVPLISLVPEELLTTLEFVLTSPRFWFGIVTGGVIFFSSRLFPLFRTHLVAISALAAAVLFRPELSTEYWVLIFLSAYAFPYLKKFYTRGLTTHNFQEMFPYFGIFMILNLLNIYNFPLLIFFAPSALVGGYGFVDETASLTTALVSRLDPRLHHRGIKTLSGSPTPVGLLATCVTALAAYEGAKIAYASYKLAEREIALKEWQAKNQASLDLWTARDKARIRQNKLDYEMAPYLDRWLGRVKKTQPEPFEFLPFPRDSEELTETLVSVPKKKLYPPTQDELDLVPRPKFSFFDLFF